jgi:hypothetical protein
LELLAGAPGREAVPHEVTTTTAIRPRYGFKRTGAALPAERRPSVVGHLVQKNGHLRNR